MSRSQCLQRLAELSYDGPTSYLMPRLREIVAEQEALGRKKVAAQKRTAKKATPK